MCASVQTATLNGKKLVSLTPQGILMQTDGAPRPLSWKELYMQAMLETDPAHMPTLIARANDAILDWLEHGDATSVAAELTLLNNALNGLRLLRREHARCLQESGELRKERKVG